MGFLPETQYQDVFSKVPRLCVDFLVEHNGKYLLTRREEMPGKGKWHIPGGRVQFRETLMQALERISRRELGYLISPNKMLGYVENTDEEGRGLHSVSVVFLCQMADPKFHENLLTENMGLFQKPPEDMLEEHKGFIENL